MVSQREAHPEQHLDVGCRVAETLEERAHDRPIHDTEFSIRRVIFLPLPNHHASACDSRGCRAVGDQFHSSVDRQ